MDLNEYYPQIFASVLGVLVYFFIKKISRRVIINFSQKSQINENRAWIVVRSFDILYVFLLLVLIFTIWGVKPDNIYAFITSVFAVVGVAMFAQWSLLSNITAGVLLFFSFPFKIGDTIRIQDKDFPIEAEISDIKAFHTLLTTSEGEKISYPNNLLLQKGIVIVNKSK